MKRPLRKRMPDTTVNREEEAAEVTRFLHQVVTEVARIHGGDPEPSFPSNPSREELAVALPGWKRFIDLAMVILLIPVWLPVMSLVALWVAITSPGLFFTGNRASDSKARQPAAGGILYVLRCIATTKSF